MRMARAIGYPARRPAASWVSDVLLTLVAACAAFPFALHERNHHPSVATAVLLVMAAVPLVARRTWPITVFGLLLAIKFGAQWWGHVDPVNAPALLIALYTVSTMRPRREALVCAGLLELAALTGSLGGSSWWFGAIFVSGLVAAALGLGLYRATRRAYLAELHDRAERLERERDQQVALAAAAERARIAREMHDIVAHNLTVMVTLSEAAVASSASSPERSAELMHTVSDTGRRALADTRRLLGVLRQRPGQDPAASREPVPDLGRLDQLIDRVRAAGLDTTLEIRGATPELPAGVQLTVYRLVQEALTNTLKHGGAGARATVRLEYQPGELRVDIDDDGAGAAPAAGGVGAGLVGMRERVHAYGGEVQAGPRPSGGWKVSARVQLDSGEAA